ncbi:hypothetical protein NWP22_12260 [Anabaenopsis tanganyikae CS-531]|uniref:Uncharacterized protein n=1 Tax=Anabaenopsis tanganyikae CS-531 TaxID=2785304 RepID=A0ABT6KFI9_9CYAN|nr:hypothetical protein [Anabaenopsis tanganyikae]MDH6106631.1 hypothetical protein [Anabaenopsis tanganyikae CS-531]
MTKIVIKSHTSNYCLSIRGYLISFEQVIFILGNREQGTGNREQGTGNGEQGMGNREQGMGNGEQGTGNGEWGMGNGEWVTPNTDHTKNNQIQSPPLTRTRLGGQGGQGDHRRKTVQSLYS